MSTIALSTGSLYSYGIARCFELAAEAGFDAVEILADHRWDSRQPTYLRQLSQETGLPIAAVHNPFRFQVPGWPQDALARLRETVAVAQTVGAPMVVAHLPLRIRALKVEFLGFRRDSLMIPLPLGGQDAYREFLLDGLARFEATEGVMVGVENMPARRILGRKTSLYWLNDLEALARLPHLTLDTTHLGTWGFDLLDVYERLKERIVHVHLSNFNGQEHRLPEDGHLPLAELLRRLGRDGYEGAVSLEVGPEVLQAEDERQVRRHLRRVVALFREHLCLPAPD